MNPGIQKTAHREHPVQAFRPVFASSRRDSRRRSKMAWGWRPARESARSATGSPPCNVPNGSADRGAASPFASARRCAA
jgi:hypothetical protein